MPLTGWLKQHTLFSHILEAGSPRSECQHDRVLLRALSQFSDSCLLTVGSHGPSLVNAHGEREGWGSLLLLIKPPILSDEDPTLMTSFNFHYFLKALSPNIVPLGVRASIHEFGEVHNLVYSTNPVDISIFNTHPDVYGVSSPPSSLYYQ